jgi:hypothetical protein
MGMLNRFIALSGAMWFSLRYVVRLKITFKEIARYFLKSFNLAICYSGFSRPGALGQAFRAGKSAFLCCAYDVVTDWRRFDSGALSICKEIILTETNSSSANIALELYRKDANDQLDEDGLERGSIALRFVTRIIGSEDFFAKKIDIDYAGRLWQLVDDLLDYEDDLQAGDLNCLDSPNRLRYIKRAESLLLEPFASTFLQDRVLAYVTRRAVEKARLMAANYYPENCEPQHLSGIKK